MLTPEAAWQLVEDELRPLPIADVFRAEAAWRTLGRDLAATVDMPQADVSAMDGYAVAGPVEPETALRVVGTAAAGRPSELVVGAGQAAKIMTGAVVPRGADRVVPVEQTDGGAERVVLRHAPAAGDHIRRCGEVVRSGQPLLTAGSLLTPGAVSLLASHGYGEVPVHRRPRVAVLTTGDEVVPADQQPGPGQLRDSNSSFLLAAGRGLGLDFEPLGIARDRRDELASKIGSGLGADVLLLCGGVSKGEFDLVEEVLAGHGCRQLFDQVAIQPGKPLVASVHDGGWVFGLPGNPASVMVTFWLFVRPLLNRLQGQPDGLWHGALQAELADPLPKSKGRDRFFAARVTARQGRLFASPLPPQGSHDVACYARGTALVRVPARRPPTPAGEPCQILPLGHWPLAG